MTNNVNELKSQSLAFTSLILYDASVEAIEKILLEKTNEYKTFFYNTGLIINIENVEEIPEISVIKDIVTKYNFILIGFSGVKKNDTKIKIFNAGYPVFNAVGAKDIISPVNNNQQTAKVQQTQQVQTKVVEKIVEKIVPATQKDTLFLRETIRSGQKIYNKDYHNLIIIGDVNEGAEVYADGNIIIEGKLEGRAVAGAKGETTAHIICNSFDPRLVSIAGVYQLGENISEDLIKARVDIRYEEDNLKYEKLK